MSVVIISGKMAVASVAFTLMWQISLEVIIVTANFVIPLSFIIGVIPP